MQREVQGAGSLLLRGLGPSGLLISRGLGGSEIDVIIPSAPETRRRKRGDGRTEEEKNRFPHSYSFDTRLVIVNGKELAHPVQRTVRIDYLQENTIRVKGTLPKSSIKRSNLSVKARLKRS